MTISFAAHGLPDNMEHKSNIQAIQLRLGILRAQIASGVFSDALVAGLNAGMGLMKRRIFNQRQDAEGFTLGPYISSQYRRKRTKAGRQVDRKDLEYDGDLRRTIEVVSVNNTKAHIRITNPENAQIAVYQEIQIANIRAGRPANAGGSERVPIFTLNETEQAIMRSTTIELIRQQIFL